jgi:hypothetical protein
MYLRRTSRKNRDGSEVSYFQLAHNVWDAEAKRSRVQIIHNFGRADGLDREALVRLCRSIARVCDVEVVDRLADEGAATHDDVLAPGVRQILTRPLGVALVVEALWQRLGIDRKLTALAAEAGQKAAYERALLAMVTNRLSVEPTSKLGVWDRWLPTVHLPSCWDLQLDDMYAAMDLLYDHAAAIEQAVFFETANLFNLEVDLVFYDTTTASFSIDQADEDEDDTPGLRKLGHSKEGTWTHQVVVALAVTRDGLPVRSWVLPGNTTDVTTVKKVREDLRGWKLGRALFVADAGVSSKDNRAELARACGHYVLACRAASVSEIKANVLSRAGRYKKVTDNLHVKEVTVGDGEKRRRTIVCHNPAQAERQSKHRDQVLEDLEELLAAHPGQRADDKWAIQLRASGRFGRYLRVTKGGRLEINRTAVREAARYDGKWVLITNDDSLAAEDAADAYKSLLVIERCFRSLKRTQIRMMPMYHWLPRRIEAHVKICVLALLIERLVERATEMPWSRIRPALDQLQATEFQTDAHRFFRINELPDEAGRILDALEISPPKPIIAVN